jgi:hypothetical protein
MRRQRARTSTSVEPTNSERSRGRLRSVFETSALDVVREHLESFRDGGRR